MKRSLVKWLVVAISLCTFALLGSLRVEACPNCPKDAKCQCKEKKAADCPHKGNCPHAKDGTCDCAKKGGKCDCAKKGGKCDCAKKGGKCDCAKGAECPHKGKDCPHAKKAK